MRSSLMLPRGVIHVISDVHGEYKKLRHVLANASGSLRPLVEEIFSGELSEVEQAQLLSVIYYPREMMEALSGQLADGATRRAWVSTTLRRQARVIRVLVRGYRAPDVEKRLEAPYQELFDELLQGEPRGPAYVDAMLEILRSRERDFAVVRAASHLIRNLSVSEVIVAGDLGDRGPRIDRVIEALRVQPNVAFAWGNHDASWMGACLGSEALIATVLRLSLRYRRLSQLEEGYGITIAPLEKLARTVYGNDPAEHFKTKGAGLRDDLLMARMQKAAAILQFKLEGQLIARHPEWELDHRRLLHRVDRNGNISLNGRSFPACDRNLPTVNEADPYALSEEEAVCMKRMRQSFVTSARLWEHMSFVARRGKVALVRDHALIFHGCVPVDAQGAELELAVDGQALSGKPLFDALERIVHRAFRGASRHPVKDIDWFWYLWSGPRSPLFGKDRMATFETYFVADPTAHKEVKNAYFSLIHDAEFCKRVASSWGLGSDSIIVNGHVPVHPEKGETPVKRGGNAVTIDGAFSEAYGDRGYTLILGPDGISLAEHHHFESIEDAVTQGTDIIPDVMQVVRYGVRRCVGDTDDGDRIRSEMAALEQLVAAYEHGDLHEKR